MAILDASTLMPPPFEDGLDIWSSEDGTPGSATYDGAANASLVSDDQDFGGCLELSKTQSIQKLRYMGQTPLTPGRYLRIRARVKAVSGNLPTVRIAGWAGMAGGVHAGGLTEVADSIILDSYGKIVTVDAVVGPGGRAGVELIWGLEAVYGHFGLDLTGPDGGVIRIDDLQIEDVTERFVREMIDVVDVKDYGAVGDGVTDDSIAFAAADAAAEGRTVLVSEGVFWLGASLALTSKVRFQGTVQMADNAILTLTKSFDLPTYIDAFGSEALGFKKAFQALLNGVDHDSLDMKGRRIDIDAPIDMQVAVSNKDHWAIRRVIRNGQLNAVDSPAWMPDAAVSTAQYSTSNPAMLTNVANVANILVGSLVDGNGVGREVYVESKNIGAATVTLSKPLYDAVGLQNYTFTRFKYLLDFSGFTHLAELQLDDIELRCDGKASGIMLAPAGQAFQIRDCAISKPADRGITSIGQGCRGMLLDRSNCVSNEQSTPAEQRTTILMNVNADDVKICNCRIVKFRHVAVMSGNGHTITGNHWLQGDDEENGTRLPGLILTKPDCKTLVTGNHIDSGGIEWTNEHDAFPDYGQQFSFGGLTLIGNLFFSSNSASWLGWLIVKPHGYGHWVQDLSVIGNVFEAVNGNVDRVEIVDDSIADLDRANLRNIVFDGNTFGGVNQPTMNPVVLDHQENTAASVWNIGTNDYLPFGGWAKTVTSVVMRDPLRDASGTPVYHDHFVSIRQGANEDQIKLNWPEAVSGRAWATIRADDPIPA